MARVPWILLGASLGCEGWITVGLLGCAATTPQAAAPVRESPRKGAPTEVAERSPAPVRPDAAVEIALGARHACARMGDGNVRCWGDNRDGQLGVPDLDSSDVPLEVPGVRGATGLGTGVDAEHTCAIVERGELLCWGNNDSGQLGDGDRAQRGVRHVPQLRDVVQVAPGLFHTCALDRSGVVHCWGSASGGALGLVPEDLAAPPVPRLVPGLSDVAHLASGAVHTCAVRRDGSVWCWGGNDEGQLGQRRPGGYRDSAPRQVPDVTGASRAFANRSTTCVRLGASTLSCWGHADMHPHAVYPGPRPVALAGPAMGFDPGRDQTCTLSDAGEVQCFGAHDPGNVGNGWQEAIGAPGRVRASGAVQVDCARAFACALLASGAVVCWSDGREPYPPREVIGAGGGAQN